MVYYGNSCLNWNTMEEGINEDKRQILVNEEVKTD